MVADLYTPQAAPAPSFLAHGASDKASWAPFATWLAGRGHEGLAIDFHGYGRSTVSTDSRALFEDVLTAVRYLRARAATRVAVLAASMGGGAVWEAAVRTHRDDLTYTIVVSNAGPRAASGMVATDTLPSGVDLVSARP